MSASGFVRFSIIFTVVLATGVAAYFSELREMVEKWSRVPDYSHGFIVLPLAVILAYIKRDDLEKIAIKPFTPGFILIFAALTIRVLGAWANIDPLQHVSLLVWVAGMVLTLGGPRFFLWALPSILFLVFMFPVPWRYESLFSRELQRIATSAGCWLLQSLGQPAFATGFVINLGEHRLEVAQACSGLRMLMGFFAICSAYVIVSSRPLWEKTLILISAIPIAVACNILRIAGTGLAYQYIANSEKVQLWTHDLAGWLMMPLAFMFLFAGLWYLDRLFVETEITQSAIKVRDLR